VHEVDQELRAPSSASDGIPRLADEIELIGEYEDSGYKEPPSIARRADGQIVQLPALLYLVAENVDGRRTYDEIAARVTEASGRGVAAEDVKFLIEEKLVPLGIVAGADGKQAAAQKADPFLALKFKVALVPERVVRSVTTLFYPFFFPPVIVAAVVALVAVDIWMFFFHGIAQAARSLVYNPVLLFGLLGLVVVGTALHEIGHATAARYGGAKPGVMGAGIYVVWPAFYTDVTDAYRLSRGGRLRTDLGGIYFNALFALGTAGVYFLTGFEPLLILVLVQHFQILQQLLPFLRLDGYYILSDLTGVPDLFARIKPTLKSLLPGKKDDRAEALKPWVRATVVAWIVLLIPVLLLTFGVLIVNAPRIFATAYDSFLVHWDKARDGFGSGATGRGALSTVQMVTLALPAVGMTLSMSRAGSRAFVGGWRWSEGAPIRRLGVISGTAGILALLGFVWYPNGEYRPIQRDERGTIQGAIGQLAAFPTGRPGLTPEREQELGGAPSAREQDPAAGEDDTTESPPPSGTTTEPATTTSESTTATTTTATTTTQPTTTTTPSTTTTP
jgi:putative peptide zinc metalloprotease protein